MSNRQITVAFPVMVVISITSTLVRADVPVIITMNGQTNSNVTYGLNQVALQVDPNLSPSTPNVSATFGPGATALDVRNGLIPVIGHDNFFRAHIANMPAAMRDFSSGSQLWIRRDSERYVLLELSVPVTLSGITFTLRRTDIGGVSAPGTIPAVGGLGLLLLATLVLAGGAAILAKRQQRLTTA